MKPHSRTPHPGPPFRRPGEATGPSGNAATGPAGTPPATARGATALDRPPTDPAGTTAAPDRPPTDPAKTTAAPGPAPTSLARMGGAVRYWLDGQARVHRLEALLARNVPVRVELLRDDRSPAVAIDALGGRVPTPRAVTRAEARQLSRLRQRNQRVGGGAITIAMPGRGGVTRAAGWVDWRDTAAYLRLTGPGLPVRGALLRADRLGVATRPAPPARADRGGSSRAPAQRSGRGDPATGGAAPATGGAARGDGAGEGAAPDAGSSAGPGRPQGTTRRARGGPGCATG